MEACPVSKADGKQTFNVAFAVPEITADGHFVLNLIIEGRPWRHKCPMDISVAIKEQVKQAVQAKVARDSSTG
jgi:hypothetical protein